MGEALAKISSSFCGQIDELYPGIEKFQNRFEPFFRGETFIKRSGLASLTVKKSYFKLDHEI